MGLKQQIQSAASPAEIDELLREGRNYAFATDDTCRKWRISAENRKAAIAAAPKGNKHRGRAA